MSDKIEKGKKGEELALEYLKKEGYAILKQNYRAGHYEIDLIAEKDGFLVFVEVKFRKDKSLVEPEASVSRGKQRNIIAAANYYMQSIRTDKEARFDIIAISISGGKYTLNHIPDAFYPLIGKR